MADAPRLRIAPSPTGYFHVGTARTAIFNWLEARRTGGTFVLRIEDTDTERNQQEAIDGIQRAMAWLGIGWDEGPIFQSANRERHVAVALDLAERGLAYWSDPMPLAGDGKPLAYDGRDRARDLPRAEGRALRFLVPHEGGHEVVHDLVRGEPTFAHDTIEDFALLRGNGEPLFLLGNVVDDLDERISVVARGEDHLSNTPKYQLLWRAVAPHVAMPAFAHLPLIVNDKRRKLSKRKGDKVAVEAFRDEGYLPEVLAGFLCLLGWSPHDGRERFAIHDVVGEFALGDVVANPAFFDQKKLDAFNGDAIRGFDLGGFTAAVQPFFGDRDPAVAAPMLPELQTRVVRLADAPAMVDFLYADPAIVADDWAKAVRQTEAVTGPLLDAVAAAWAAAPWDADALKAALVAAGEAHGLNLKKAQAPVRVALTGRAVGPPLFESAVVLGPDEVAARLAAARARLG